VFEEMMMDCLFKFGLDSAYVALVKLFVRLWRSIFELFRALFENFRAIFENFGFLWMKMSKKSFNLKFT
jgi:hypothetical protein